MTALLSGLGFGFGLLLVVRGLRPARPSLATSLERARSVPAAGSLTTRTPPGAEPGAAGVRVVLP